MKSVWGIPFLPFLFTSLLGCVVGAEYLVDEEINYECHEFKGTFRNKGHSPSDSSFLYLTQLLNYEPKLIPDTILVNLEYAKDGLKFKILNRERENIYSGIKEDSSCKEGVFKTTDLGGHNREGIISAVLINYRSFINKQGQLIVNRTMSEAGLLFFIPVAESRKTWYQFDSVAN